SIANPAVDTTAIARGRQTGKESYLNRRGKLGMLGRSGEASRQPHYLDSKLLGDQVMRAPVFMVLVLVATILCGCSRTTAPNSPTSQSRKPEPTSAARRTQPGQPAAPLALNDRITANQQKLTQANQRFAAV